MKKIPILYVYDEVVGSFESIKDLYLERMIIRENTINEQEIYNATNSLKKIHYRVSNRPNKILYNIDTLVYTVWMNQPNEAFAKKIIFDYLKELNTKSIAYHTKKITIHENNIVQAQNSLV